MADMVVDLCVADTKVYVWVFISAFVKFIKYVKYVCEKCRREIVLVKMFINM
jgi:hypothetical protein